jgi:hypothetical protein
MASCRFCGMPTSGTDTFCRKCNRPLPEKTSAAEDAMVLEVPRLRPTPEISPSAAQSGRRGWRVPAAILIAALGVGVSGLVGILLYTNYQRSSATVGSSSRPASTDPMQTTAVNHPGAQQNAPIAAQPTTERSIPSGSMETPEAKQPDTTSPVAVSKIQGASKVEQVIKGSPPMKPQISTPISPISGMLHYSGPAVGYGGTVVFSNLPGERLRFTFDQQSWQPLIAHLPDGTQKLTLLSLKKGNQVQCDVHWEIAR